MLQRYRLFLYKLLTTPSPEKAGSATFTTFLAMVLIQGVNLASVLNVVRTISPALYTSLPKAGIVAVIFLPPLLLNYLVIYYHNGSAEILKEFAHEKRGTLKYLVMYGMVSVGVLFVTVRVMRGV